MGKDLVCLCIADECAVAERGFIKVSEERKGMFIGVF